MPSRRGGTASPCPDGHGAPARRRRLTPPGRRRSGSPARRPLGRRPRLDVGGVLEAATAPLPRATFDVRLPLSLVPKYRGRPGLTGDRPVSFVVEAVDASDDAVRVSAHGDGLALESELALDRSRRASDASPPAQRGDSPLHTCRARVRAAGAGGGGGGARPDGPLVPGAPPAAARVRPGHVAAPDAARAHRASTRRCCSSPARRASGSAAARCGACTSAGAATRRGGPSGCRTAASTLGAAELLEPGEVVLGAGRGVRDAVAVRGVVGPRPGRV